MNKDTHPLTIILVFIIVIAAIYGITRLKDDTVTIMIGDHATTTASSTNTTASTSPVVTGNTVLYMCDSKKTITATYMNGNSTTTSSIVLALSDGRTLTLAQTTSADGARYTNTDESIIFWSKGTGLTFVEHNKQTYVGCIEVAKDTGGLPQIYENSVKGFSIRYPSGYTVNDKYVYEALGPGKSIQGVKFTIPATLTTGTNLSTDSYVSVEVLSNQSTCSAAPFVNQGFPVKDVDDNGMTYSVGTSADAGAGNRYDETVYAIPGSSPCMAVRYFIHYGAIGNYPSDVHEFDKAALMDVFDRVRRTLVIGR